jgi:hypothetical protein
VSKGNSPEFCDCGFEQFKTVFKDADQSQAIAKDDPRLQTLKEKTISECASKISEEQVQSSFTTQCVSGDERKRAYCTCAWPALRQNLEVADMASLDAEAPKFVAARKSMVVTCKGKFPVEVAKADFMQGCMAEDAKATERCGCLWKKIKAKFSAEEVVAGVADISTIKDLADCKNK